MTLHRRNRSVLLTFAVAALATSPGLTAASGQASAKSATASVSPKTLPARVKEFTFFSKSLRREMHYRVLLPARYKTTRKRYPTLFLLHGLYGDFTNWTTLTHVAQSTRNLDLILAMPDAGNSWYVNSATEENDKFEDYIVQDFVSEIDEHFRTIRERGARAIAGLSMGGYAALNFSIKHPKLFSYAGAFSAALDAPQDLDERVSEYAPSLDKAFGPHASATRSTNDVFLVLENAASDGLPYVYVDCGEGDGFLPVNRALATKLRGKKVSYEYHEFPGAHEWAYWNAAIQRYLAVLAAKQFFQSGSSSNEGSRHSEP
jgi:S-formylglutathione hydrolase FrmB